ncbi:Fanconi anemia core complex-associated protein 100 [Triplophysa rosa]|uniref:Fanconi anemia core complex-associated protein 100 n=1 Tax=Triplophysa rosa TaxID=992332 RepID=UPI0025460A30|nr:Fanconi anemia core complex-associated protein 100 [Triplophysa rosa]
MDAMRCSVAYLSEFSDCQSHSSRIIQYDTNLILTCGDSHVLVFHIEENRVTTVLHYETPVTYVALSADKLRLYVLCENGGLYCTTLPPPSSSDPVVTRVSDDCIVLKNTSLRAIIIVEKILVTLSLHKSTWSLDVYEEPGSKPLHKLACFQVTTVNTQATHNSSNTTEDVINITDEEKSRKSSPVLTCIYSAVSHKSELHPYLELRLFRLLFGVDASLVNSPVLLCGLPDGRICCFPLLLPQMDGPRGEQRSPIRVLQSLEQPIVFIGTCVSGDDGPRCLVALGQRGKLLLVRSKETSSESKKADYSFNEHSVRGPVLCACADDKYLFYSTLNDLQALQLTKTSPETEAATEPQHPVLSSNSLGVCGVVALAGPYTNATGSLHLLASSSSGRLMQVNLPQGPNKENESRFSSSQAGQRVKDLLSSIGNVWEEAESLKHKLQEKNESLKRLNQVMSVCNLLLANHGNEMELNKCIQPISCHGVARWSSLLQKESLTLTCVLENASMYTLEQGWTLCLQVHPLSTSQTANTECTSRTYSFPFRKLDCGEKLDVTIPLERVGELPVNIYCSLAFTLTALFSSEASEAVSQLLKGMGSISVPLNTLTVDWLDSLRLEGAFSPGNIIRHNTAADGIQAFLRSKGVRTQNSDIVPKSGPLPVVVRVSSELLKSKLHLSATSGVEICSSVLNWLVYKETAERASIKTQVVCAYSPDGQPVKLLAKEMTLEDFSSEGPLDVLEIRVESLSMVAVCGLHHAILRRLQVLLEDTTANRGHTKPLQAQRLCETVRHVESLYKDLQDAYNQAALGGSTETNKTSEILFRIFLQLRATPLIII